MILPHHALTEYHRCRHYIADIGNFNERHTPITCTDLNLRASPLSESVCGTLTPVDDKGESETPAVAPFFVIRKILANKRTGIRRGGQR